MAGKKYWYVMYYITYQYFFKFEYNVFAWDPMPLVMMLHPSKSLRTAP